MNASSRCLLLPQLSAPDLRSGLSFSCGYFEKLATFCPRSSWYPPPAGHHSPGAWPSSFGRFFGLCGRHHLPCENLPCRSPISRDTAPRPRRTSRHPLFALLSFLDSPSAVSVTSSSSRLWDSLRLVFQESLFSLNNHPAWWNFCDISSHILSPQDLSAPSSSELLELWYWACFHKEILFFCGIVVSRMTFCHPFQR